MIDNIRQTAEQLFKQQVQVMFDKDPTLTSISWSQYTDNYNDGEQCSFGIQGVLSYHWNSKFPLLSTQEILDETPSYEGPTHPSFVWDTKDPDLIELNKEYMLQFVSSDTHIDQSCEWFFKATHRGNEQHKNLLLFLFGDHTKVVIYRDEETGLVEFYQQEYTDHN